MSFSFTVPATTGVYALSLHDALPICGDDRRGGAGAAELGPAGLTEGVVHRDARLRVGDRGDVGDGAGVARSEEHTSELQSRRDPVCRLLPEKKKLCRVRTTPAGLTRP